MISKKNPKTFFPRGTKVFSVKYGIGYVVDLIIDETLKNEITVNFIQSHYQLRLAPYEKATNNPKHYASYACRKKEGFPAYAWDFTHGYLDLLLPHTQWACGDNVRLKLQIGNHYRKGIIADIRGEDYLVEFIDDGRKEWHNYLFLEVINPLTGQLFRDDDIFLPKNVKPK